MSRIFSFIIIFNFSMSLSSQESEKNHKEWQSGSFVQKSIPHVKEFNITSNTVKNSGTIPLREGWPIKVGIYPQYPVAMDLTGDGRKEVIIADQDGYLHVFTDHGEYLSSAWPKRLGFQLSAPAIADIDQDGELEIIVVESTDLFSDYFPNGRVHVLESNGEYVSGWPFMLDGYHGWINSVSISDIDRDGRLNIITATGSSFSNFGTIIYFNKIYVFNPDGTLLSGWPSEPSAEYDNEMYPRSPLVLVDLDQDSFLEIISGFWYCLDPNGGKNGIFALNHDGTIVNGFPIRNEDWNYALASADMDNDGVYEIYSMARRYDRYGNHDGTWNMANPGGHALAFADVNNDGYPEIIYGCGAVYIVDRHGNLLPGWPQYTRPEGDIVDGNPIAGDIDGDGDIEILIGSYYTNNVFAWHHDGSPVSGFPVTTGGCNGRISIVDLDGDGDIELISSCEDSLVYVWDIPATGPCTKMEWPMYQHDEWHTGVYPSSNGTPVIEDPENRIESFQLEQNFPNPFNSQTRIRFTLGENTSSLEIQVFNIKGELIRTLSRNQFYSSGSHENVWDGKNDIGQEVPSGLYMIQMSNGVKKEMKKILLVK